MPIDRLTGPHSLKVTLTGKVDKGLEVGPELDDDAYVETYITVECQGQFYSLHRVMERDRCQELKEEYQAIMDVGRVYAEGLISYPGTDIDERLVIGIDVDHWQPVGTETGNAAPAGASRGKMVTLILQPCDGQDLSDLPDCIEVKSDLAASVEAILRGGMKNGLAFQH